MASASRLCREPIPGPLLESLILGAFIASTWNAATSMAAAVPNISTESTSREVFFFRTRIPSNRFDFNIRNRGWLARAGHKSVYTRGCKDLQPALNAAFQKYVTGKQGQ